MAGAPFSGGHDEQGSKILRSLRIAGRFVLLVTAFIITSRAILGRGSLYHLAKDFAWLGAIPIGFVLVKIWRRDIANAYLHRRASGRMAVAVRATRDRWYGFFVVVVAFFYVFAHAAARTMQRFVLGFEQSRRALAFLFLRRLERRIESEIPPSLIDELPDAVMRHLAERPTDEDPYVVGRFPELDDAFGRMLTRWKAGDQAGTFLLVGKTGYGKTSWLNSAARRVGAISTVRVDLDHHVTQEEELINLIAKAIGMSDEDGNVDRAVLTARLRETHRVVVVDDLQNLVLRAPAALEVWRGFLALISATADVVFWLCAMAHYPHEFLIWARRGPDAFRIVMKLPPWTEAEIAELLRTRTQATGFTPIYDDMVVDKLEGIDQQAQVLSTERDYMRLIWDYAEGSPRVALDCWTASLAPAANNQLRVHLFRRPDSNALEALSEPQRLVLASVVWHENVSPEEAARSLRLPLHACRETLERLRETGTLRLHQGRYRVTAAWWPAVIRFLRRKHFIES